MPWPKLPGNRSMLIRAVKGTEWSQFLDYASPSFFDVVPLSGLLAQGRELAANAAGPSVDDVRNEIREHVLRAHFGAGDQRAVRFQTEVFQSTFHDAFLRCRDASVKLHRNFLVLGLYLACLYDLLETLDLEFDVRAAYELGAGEA